MTADVLCHLETEAEQLTQRLPPVEAEARPGWISPESPLGAALLGRQAGDIGSPHTPTGPLQFTLMDVA
jgi:transcription elongation GreA/GreB family factor